MNNKRKFNRKDKNNILQRSFFVDLQITKKESDFLKFFAGKLLFYMNRLSKKFNS